MNEAITLCGVQPQGGQSVTPPPIDINYANDLAEYFLREDICKESRIPSEFSEVWVYLRSNYIRWSGVPRQPVNQRWHSRDIPLQSQVVTALDEIISKINIALQVPDIDEDVFPFVSRLLYIEGLSLWHRVALFPCLPDFDRAIHTMEIACHFLNPSEGNFWSFSVVLEELRRRKRIFELIVRKNIPSISRFEKYEEHLERATKFVECTLSDPSHSIQPMFHIGLVGLLHDAISSINGDLKSLGTKGKLIPIIAGVLPIRGALQAYRLCLLKSIDDLICSIRTVKTVSHYFERIREPDEPWFTDLSDPVIDKFWPGYQVNALYTYTSTLLRRKERIGINHLLSRYRPDCLSPSTFLCEALLYISLANDRLSSISREVELRTVYPDDNPQSELLAIVGTSTSIIDKALEIVDIDEGALELVVGLLLAQLYTLIVYSRLRSEKESEHLPSTRDLRPPPPPPPDYSDRIKYISKIIHHFCGPSMHTTGIVLKLSTRFQWPYELSAFFALSSVDPTQNAEDLAHIEKHILIVHPRFTSTKLAMAVIPLVTAVGRPVMTVPQEGISSCKGILQSCKEYIPAIEDTGTRVCLRDYGTRSSMRLFAAHDNYLRPCIFKQVLDFVDLCVQHRIDVQQPQELLVRSRNDNLWRADEQPDDMDLEWRLLAVFILYKLLDVAAIAGDAAKLDAVIERLQRYSLPHRQYGAYGMLRKWWVTNANDSHSAVTFQARIAGEWDDGKLRGNAITAFKQQFHSDHISETHKTIIALILASSLFNMGSSTSVLLESASSASHEACPYFAYFLIHSQPFEASAWTTPTCEFLYSQLCEGGRGGLELSIRGHLVRTTVREVWDRWKQGENGSLGIFKSYQRHPLRADEITAIFRSQSTSSLNDPSQPKPNREKTTRDIDIMMKWDKNPTVMRLLEKLPTSIAISESMNRILAMTTQFHHMDFGDHKWLHALDKLESIANDLHIEVALRVSSIMIWYRLILILLGTSRFNDHADLQRRCDAHLPRISMISWGALEEMSWTASSVWESIADRQGVFTSLRDFFVATTIAIRSLSEFVVEALEMWEGQGMIWTQLRHLRFPVDRLAKVNQGLAVRLQTLQEMFDKRWVQTGDDEQRGLAIAYYEKSNSKLHQEWIDVLTEIRSLPGFEMFFKGKTFDELKEASRNGPVVFLPSPHNHWIQHPRPDPIVFIFYRRQLGNNQEEPAVDRVSLPLLTNEVLMGLRRSLTGIARTRHGSDDTDEIFPEGGNGHLSARADSDSYEFSQQDSSYRFGHKPRRSQDAPMFAILRDLWNVVAEPILDSIMQSRGDNKGDRKGESKALHWQDKPPNRGERGRIWWCCLGEFSFLPIHAAGIYRNDRSSTCVSDFFISSYTPSLSALIDARNRPLPQPEDIKVLAAAQPKPDSRGESKWKPLPSTTKELKEIAAIIPKQNLLYLNDQDELDFTGEHTTVQNVLDVLPEASILHLACHGEQDRDNPVKSGFILKNAERLTIQELIKQRTPKAYLAILSACHTASNDALQPEESMNLTRTAIFLGFSTIVGTKWPMADADGPAVAKAVYSALFGALNSRPVVSDQLTSSNGTSTPVDATRPHPHNPLESFCLARVIDDFVFYLRNRPGPRVPATRWATFVHIGI